jgi:hypothetical protein
VLLSGHVADRQGDKLTDVADRSDKGMISMQCRLFDDGDDDDDDDAGIEGDGCELNECVDVC